MLNRSNRISKRQLESVLKGGRVIHSPLFLMRFAIVDKTKENEASSRLAAIVPVKIGKTSVIRHKVRRLMYEASRPFMKTIVGTAHILLFAKAPALTAPLPSMSADIKNLFVKAGLLR